MAFLSTPSARRATDLIEPEAVERKISIHALREEGDAVIAARRPPSNDFYPRPPRGGRRCIRLNDDAGNAFLSTPSARRATHIFHAGGQAGKISIHALREEGDSPHRRPRRPAPYFYPRPPRGGRLDAVGVGGLGQLISIHALREEGDVHRLVLHRGAGEFLSTPSARRATTRSATIPARSTNFYPRPPRGGRLDALYCHDCESVISIHALREEGDDAFLLRWLRYPISIHALREEGDTQPT